MEKNSYSESELFVMDQAFHLPVLHLDLFILTTNDSDIGIMNLLQLGRIKNIVDQLLHLLPL